MRFVDCVEFWVMDFVLLSTFNDPASTQTGDNAFRIFP